MEVLPAQVSGGGGFPPQMHTHLLMEVPLTDLWAAKAEALVISRFLGLQCDPTQDLGSQVPNVEA